MVIGQPALAFETAHWVVFDVEWADLQLQHDFDVIVERGRIV